MKTFCYHDVLHTHEPKSGTWRQASEKVFLDVDRTIQSDEHIQPKVVTQVKQHLRSVDY